MMQLLFLNTFFCSITTETTKITSMSTNEAVCAISKGVCRASAYLNR